VHGGCDSRAAGEGKQHDDHLERPARGSRAHPEHHHEHEHHRDHEGPQHRYPDAGGRDRDALAYSTKTLAAKTGRVTITMTNMSPLEHNLTIAQGSNVLGATPTFTGGTKALSLVLKPGTYTFYCSVPGHRQAGMEGTLTVS
jgi:plastocyanin